MTKKPYIEKDGDNNSEVCPGKKVSIIIPAFNEEDSIAAQIRSIQDVMDKTEWTEKEIIQETIDLKKLILEF